MFNDKPIIMIIVSVDASIQKQSLFPLITLVKKIVQCKINVKLNNNYKKRIFTIFSLHVFFNIILNKPISIYSRSIKNVTENISTRDGEFFLFIIKEQKRFALKFSATLTKYPHLFFRCWMLPRHLKRPFTMIAMRVHKASHSSMLLREKKHRLSKKPIPFQKLRYSVLRKLFLLQPVAISFCILFLIPFTLHTFS